MLRSVEVRVSGLYRPPRVFEGSRQIRPPLTVLVSVWLQGERVAIKRGSKIESEDRAGLGGGGRRLGGRQSRVASSAIVFEERFRIIVSMSDQHLRQELVN